MNKVTDVVKEGDKVKVKLLGFDERGKVRLSMKVVDQQTGEDLEAKQKAEQSRGSRGRRELTRGHDCEKRRAAPGRPFAFAIPLGHLVSRGPSRKNVRSQPIPLMSVVPRSSNGTASPTAARYSSLT